MDFAARQDARPQSSGGNLERHKETRKEFTLRDDTGSNTPKEVHAASSRKELAEWTPLDPRTSRQDQATDSRRAAGFCLAMVRRRSAALCGRRNPCSQLLTHATLVPRKRAISAWLRPRAVRILRISFGHKAAGGRSLALLGRWPQKSHFKIPRQFWAIGLVNSMRRGKRR